MARTTVGPTTGNIFSPETSRFRTATTDRDLGYNLARSKGNPAGNILRAISGLREASYFMLPEGGFHELWGTRGIPRHLHAP